jgi:hypothetical protein
MRKESPTLIPVTAKVPEEIRDLLQAHAADHRRSLSSELRLAAECHGLACLLARVWQPSMSQLLDPGELTGLRQRIKGDYLRVLAEALPYGMPPEFWADDDRVDMSTD